MHALGIKIIATMSNVILGELNGRGIGVVSVSVMSGRTKISLHWVTSSIHYDNKYTTPTGTSTKFCFATPAYTATTTLSVDNRCKNKTRIEIICLLTRDSTILLCC